MKMIPINVSNTDYEWLSVQAKQRKMTVATIIEEMVVDASQRADEETQYLLNDPKMRERLLTAKNCTEGIPYEVVREKLGIFNSNSATFTEAELELTPSI